MLIFELVLVFFTRLLILKIAAAMIKAFVKRMAQITTKKIYFSVRYSLLASKVFFPEM